MRDFSFAWSRVDPFPQKAPGKEMLRRWFTLNMGHLRITTINYIHIVVLE